MPSDTVNSFEPILGPVPVPNILYNFQSLFAYTLSQAILLKNHTTNAFLLSSYYAEAFVRCLSVLDYANDSFYNTSSTASGPPSPHGEGY